MKIEINVPECEFCFDFICPNCNHEEHWDWYGSSPIHCEKCHSKYEIIFGEIEIKKIN